VDAYPYFAFLQASLAHEIRISWPPFDASLGRNGNLVVVSCVGLEPHGRHNGTAGAYLRTNRAQTAGYPPNVRTVVRGLVSPTVVHSTLRAFDKANMNRCTWVVIRLAMMV
jgi:hypothetical protein